MPHLLHLLEVAFADLLVAWRGKKLRYDVKFKLLWEIMKGVVQN